VPALFAYAADEFGDEFFAEAWEEFFLWDVLLHDAPQPCGTQYDHAIEAFTPD
jgi:hypothetical protein